MNGNLTIFESILDDIEASDNSAVVKSLVSDIQNQRISYQQWYQEVSNGNYEQMYCVSHHFMGLEYVRDIEDFREDLIRIIERFFGNRYSLQIVASTHNYEDIGIQYEPDKRKGGPILNEVDFTNNQVRFKFAVEFPVSGRRKVFKYLDFAASVYRLIRRPTSGQAIVSRKKGILDSGRLEIYPFVDEENKYIWGGVDNTDCIVASSAYEWRYNNDYSKSNQDNVADLSDQMYAIDLCREAEEPYEYRDYRSLCYQWMKKRKV